ncbi:hypothetical protein FQR65_LT01820 [Abscondita terminalis]|nr:hypothetical protein FQR65_LT01820 [Abscondita terminalis]
MGFLQIGTCLKCYSCVGTPVHVPHIPNMPPEIKTVSQACFDPFRGNELQDAQIDCDNGISTCMKIDIRVGDGSCKQCYSCIGTPVEVPHIPNAPPQIKIISPACSNSIDLNELRGAKIDCNDGISSCMKINLSAGETEIVMRGCLPPSICDIFKDCHICSGHLCNSSSAILPSVLIISMISSCKQCYSCIGTPVDVPDIPNRPPQIKLISPACSNATELKTLQNAAIECNDGISTCLKIKIEVENSSCKQCYACVGAPVEVPYIPNRSPPTYVIDPACSNEIELKTLRNAVIDCNDGVSTCLKVYIPIPGRGSSCKQCYACVGAPVEVPYIPNRSPPTYVIDPACSNEIELKTLRNAVIDCNDGVSTCLKVYIPIPGRGSSCKHCYSCIGTPVEVPDANIPNRPPQIKIISPKCFNGTELKTLQNAAIDCNDGVSTCLKINIKVGDTTAVVMRGCLPPQMCDIFNDCHSCSGHLCNSSSSILPSVLIITLISVMIGWMYV